MNASSRPLRPLLALIAALLFAVSAGPALAAAAGSADDMYVETPPDPTGEGRPSGDLGDGDPSVVPAATAAALGRMGDAGQSALRAAQRTAPRTPAGTSAGPADGSSAIGGLISPLAGAGSGGMGIFLPLILLAALGAGIYFAVQRRRA